VLCFFVVFAIEQRLEDQSIKGTQAMIPCTLVERGYIRDECVGQGSFGTTFKVRRLEADSSATHVVKQVMLKKLDEKHMKHTFKEVELLKNCDHINIVKYVDSFLDKERQLNIIMEYCSQGDLTTKVGRVGEGTLWSYTIQILQGLKYLHDQRILHRDIKPSNILLAECGNVKIADMGLGRVMSAETQFAETFCGTPLYIAPELHADDCKYDGSCDIWALGCTIYELAAGIHPFKSSSYMSMLRKIQEVELGSLPPTFSPELRFLVLVMLRKNAAERPKCNDFFDFFPIRRRVEAILLRRQHRQIQQRCDLLEKAAEQRQQELEALTLENERLQQRVHKYKAKARAWEEKHGTSPKS
jgi:NIMA (never in mitosis gene a)-related kinase